MIFITGGAKSGKSALAEKMARDRGGPVTYIATARAGDEEMRGRIAEHRRRRPGAWKTVEAFADLPAVLAETLDEPGTVLVDCLTVYLSNLLLSDGPAAGKERQRLMEQEMDRVADLCLAAHGRVILVSNEVGMGIVPDNKLARDFRDIAGRVNQKMAAAADEVHLCVSGISVRMK